MIRAFVNDQSGAITGDWVSLTSGVLLLGIAVAYAIFGAVGGTVVRINGGFAGILSEGGKGSVMCKKNRCFHDEDGDGLADYRTVGGVERNGRNGVGRNMAGLAKKGFTETGGSGSSGPAVPIL